ncbi:hypothetical protein ACFWJS_14795 [Streptomyces sp. NPDC127061]|uniref:hypothetical protein n=1 Tax=Streptomyces sp. NPDC127061 TaxID=3347122 RepID=UPI003652F286
MAQNRADGDTGRHEPQRRIAQGDGHRTGQLLPHPAGLPGGPCDRLAAGPGLGVVAAERRLDAGPWSLARYACAVESVRHPELREILVPRRNAAREAVRAFLHAQGVTDAEGRTLTLLACVDGLVFDRLVGGGGAVPRDEIAGLVAAALRDPGGEAGATAAG